MCQQDPRCEIRCAEPAQIDFDKPMGKGDDESIFKPLDDLYGKDAVKMFDGKRDTHVYHEDAGPMYDPNLWDTADDGEWKIDLTGKDLFIAALVVLNLVMVAGICWVCAGKKGESKKYAAVYAVDSSEEMEMRQR